MTRTSRRRGALALALALVATGTAASAAAAGDPVDPTRTALVVSTAEGAVQGGFEGEVEQWLGVRYAAAPTGDQRWRPPQPEAPWEGVRRAQDLGSTCPQPESIDGPRTEDEDCLFVNVQRPAGTGADDALPVYVVLHGGGLVGGSGNNEDLGRIVEQTGVVGVSVNYRLGALGSLAHPALSAEAGESGNYGLLDQQAALRWVQRNIEAFGGDPARVTIAGESAGALSVCTHLVSPGSQGLFAGAVLQSGYCGTDTQAEAEAVGTTAAADLGCTDGPDAAACLRSAPVDALLGLQLPLPRPVRGTSFLPVEPLEAIAAGDVARVPAIVGSTRDEYRPFTTDAIGSTEQQYRERLTAIFGERAEEIAARYPWPDDADEFTAAYLLGAVLTDASTDPPLPGPGAVFTTGAAAGFGACGTRSFAAALGEQTDVYAYEFAPPRDAPAWGDPPGYESGAGHATDLPYLYPERSGGLDAAEFNDDEVQLADEMKQYWGAFTHTGQPAVDGQAAWPERGQEGALLSLRTGGESTVVSDEDFATEHQCDSWSAPAGR